jgi:hypothetical protein
MVAHVLAERGDPAARAPIAVLGRWRPAEAGLITALLETHRGNFSAAASAYVAACAAFRRDAWTWSVLARRLLPLGTLIANADTTGRLAPGLFDALATPFAGDAAESARLLTRVGIASRLDRGAPGEHVRQALDAFRDRDFPWDRNLLAIRAACYRNLDDPRQPRAKRELERFLARDETATISMELRRH